MRQELEALCNTTTCTEKHACHDVSEESRDRRKRQSIRAHSKEQRKDRRVFVDPLLLSAARCPIPGTVAEPVTATSSATSASAPYGSKLQLLQLFLYSALVEWGRACRCLTLLIFKAQAAVVRRIEVTCGWVRGCGGQEENKHTQHTVFLQLQNERIPMVRLTMILVCFRTLLKDEYPLS